MVKEGPGGGPGGAGGRPGGPGGAKRERRGGARAHPGGTRDIELTSRRHLRAQMAPWGRLKIKRYS